MSADSGLEKNYWQSAVHRLSRRIHFGWWLDHWLSLLIPLSLLGAVAILGLRYWRDLPLPAALIGIGSALALAAVVALFLMHRRREWYSPRRKTLKRPSPSGPPPLFPSAVFN